MTNQEFATWFLVGACSVLLAAVIILSESLKTQRKLIEEWKAEYSFAKTKYKEILDLWQAERDISADLRNKNKDLEQKNKNLWDENEALHENEALQSRIAFLERPVRNNVIIFVKNLKERWWG